MKLIYFQLVLSLCYLVASGFSQAEVVLNPVADTYVKDSAVNSNYGTASNFIANNDNGIRVSFLRFDLSGISGPITNARLELTVNLASVGQSFNVYGLTNGENWSETGMTWSNAPAVVNSYVGVDGTLAQYLKPSDLFNNGVILNTFTSGAVGTVDEAFDSTSSALNFITADGDKIITFVIAEPDPVDAGGVAWNSRETAFGVPALIINTNSDGNSNTNSSSSGDDALKILHVYLQGGQSNSDGRAKTNGLPANLIQFQNDVPFYYYLTGSAANGDGTLGHLIKLHPGCSAQGSGSYFGPELTFGRTLADYFGASNNVSTNDVMVAIIKYAHGGTSLVTNWKANGTNGTNGDGTDYVIFQQVVAAGLTSLAKAYPNAAIELDGMIWVQGESDIDAGAAASTAYGTNLTRFITDIRRTYAENKPYGTNLPFFLSQISANQTYYSLPTDSSYSNYLVLRACQAKVTDTMTNVFMINTDDPKFSTLTPGVSPGLHFDTGGQKAMGAAFGKAVIEALPRPWLALPIRSGSNWNVGFTGVAGTMHFLERSFSPSGPWTVVTNVMIGPLGYTNCDDQEFSNAFYRVSGP